MIRWVGQEDDCGCGCAAVAMLAGVSYADVRAHIGGKDLTERGMTMWDWECVLTEMGYATGRLYRVRQYPETNTERAVWPPEPWADAHLCEVIVSEASRQAHMVVVLRDGTVLDPLTPEPRRLGDYYRVTSIAAVVPVGSRP